MTEKGHGDVIMRRAPQKNSRYIRQSVSPGETQTKHIRNPPTTSKLLTKLNHYGVFYSPLLFYLHSHIHLVGFNNLSNRTWNQRHHWCHSRCPNDHR